MNCPSKAFDNQNLRAYRLGDVVLQNGLDGFALLRKCTKKLHANSLASKFLHHPEYVCTSNRTFNLNLFDKVLMQNCKFVYEGEVPNVIIHLRFGDAVYGLDKFSRLRRPFPLRCFEALNMTNEHIGFVYNHSSASHTAENDEVYAEGLENLERYLHRLYHLFPSATYFLPNGSPDVHLCAMVAANVYVQSTGNVACVVKASLEII